MVLVRWQPFRCGKRGAAATQLGLELPPRLREEYGLYRAREQEAQSDPHVWLS